MILNIQIDHNKMTQNRKDIQVIQKGFSLMQLIQNTAGINAYVATGIRSLALLTCKTMNYLVNNMSKQFIKFVHCFDVEFN